MVSNRLPSTFYLSDGKVTDVPSVGGLATGVGSVFPYNKRDAWIGWPGYIPRNPEEEKVINTLCMQKQLVPVYLTKEEIRDYYEGFCNCSVWPNFHYFNEFVQDKEDWWLSYRAVNKKFCNAIVKVADDNSTIWINDFHLMLLPQLLKEQNVEAKVGFFLHTPFPDEATFERMPQNMAILRSLLCSDSIGFYLEPYRVNFIKVVRRFLPDTTIKGYAIGTTQVGIFPIGIDYPRYSEIARQKAVEERSKELRKSIASDVILLSIDRLDYTKGIPEKLIAFELFLKRGIIRNQKVSLFLIVVPSRENVKENILLKNEIERLVMDINDKYSIGDWSPVVYCYRTFNTMELSAFYSMADVMVITSRADGMNLVCKEFIASKNDNKGVLVLSTKAGAAEVLSESVLVDPNSIESIFNGLTKAIEILDNNAPTMFRLREEVMKNDIHLFARNFIASID